MGRLVWDRDGRDWPNRAASRFVAAAGLRWHVQVFGSGPSILLIHGTGASTHSWRVVAPILAESFTVIAPDLPGHAFTDTPPQAGFRLPAVAAGIGALLRELRLAPVVAAAGHSAGAAVAIRMALDGAISPASVVSLNGALFPFHGPSDSLFGPIARILASTPLTAQAFTLFAGGRSRVERMVASSGSRIDARGLDLYVRLAGNPVHVGGALSLMANWDLHPLVRDMPRLTPHLMLVTGSRDGMVPPSEATRVRRLVPGAEHVSMPGLGHLAHEERPADAAALIARAAGMPG